MLTASVVLQAMRSNGYALPFVPRRSTVIGVEFFFFGFGTCRLADVPFSRCVSLL